MGIKNFFNPNRQEAMSKNLLNLKGNTQLFNKLTTLQNEVTVSSDAKVVAITSISNDLLASSFAKAFAETYSLNGSSSLIIDANLYNPTLAKLLGKPEGDAQIDDGDKFELQVIDEKSKAICLEKNIYPSDVYKSGKIQKMVNDNLDKYEHIIILVPSIKEYKEVSLISDVVKSVILIAQRNITKKKDIYESLVYFNTKKLPLAKVVILK